MQKLLVLSANPKQDFEDLGNLSREVSDLYSVLKRLQKFDIEMNLAACPEDVKTLLLEHKPQVVHFCGHGAGDNGLVFQDENGRAQFIKTEPLTKLFKLYAKEANCVVLNACDSDQQAAAIVEHVNYVIGMSQPILDRTAFFFATGFYQGLAHGSSIEESYEMGCLAIQIESEKNSQSRQYRKAEYVGAVALPTQPELPEHLKPVLRKKNTLLPSSAEVNPVQAVLVPSVPMELPPEFEQVVRQEIDRKDYKDQARAAYDNFGQFSAENAAELKKSEYAQRKIVVGKVKKCWIEGFLKPSLQGNTMIHLDLTDRPEAVADLSQGIEALSVELDDSYEELRDTQIYGEIGQGRTLLILGDPGAGKTIALLQLAQRLIERSEQNLSLPMPIVFNLSSWAKEGKSIVDWLIDELREKYQVPKSLGGSWIKHQQLILLLDGLDEVKEEDRNECVRALNQFIRLFPKTEVAVCSRVQDYEALIERLQISSALCLQPLSSKQVYQFLDSPIGSLAGLKTLLKSNSELEQFAQTPLILNFMSVAYQGWLAKELIPQLSSASKPECQQHLFETYIDVRLRQGVTSEYSKDKVLHWLHWLASQMMKEKQTIFLIEKMQPNWLPEAHTRLYQFSSFLIGAVLTVLMLWPIYAFDPLHGLGFWGNVTTSKGGLINVLRWGLVLGLFFGWDKTEIKTVETLTWPWKKMRKDLLRGLRLGLKKGLIFSLILTPIYGLWIGLTQMYGGLLSGLEWGIEYGLKLGLSLGLTLGLINALKDSEVEEKTIPNQGIWKSAINAGVTGVISWLILVPIYWLNSNLITTIFWGMIKQLEDWSRSSLVDLITPSLRWGLMLGLVFGGGVACIRHFSLRLILHRNNYIPWNYAEFLNFASDRLLMKKIGGGYIFFHRMLLEHFDRMNPS